MNVFLTGGTGFIGSHILMQLVEAGHNVRVLARNVNKVPALHKIAGVSLIEGQLTDLKLLEKAVKGMDAVVHVALNYNDTSGYDMLVSDTLPSVYLADAAARAGVKDFIYTSSTAVNDFVYMTEQPKFEGGAKHSVYEDTKQKPATFYGATKASVENYLLALSYQSKMKVNFVRPGYTFGNPVIDGAYTQADTRFADIVRDVKAGKDVKLTKGDGTQFIYAGDLAKIYMNILDSEVNRNMYFGLSAKFVSWAEIAKRAQQIAKSDCIIVENDEGWSDDPILFDVAAIKRDFNLKFDPWSEIERHINYYLELLG